MADRAPARPLKRLEDSRGVGSVRQTPSRSCAASSPSGRGRARPLQSPVEAERGLGHYGTGWSDRGARPGGLMARAASMDGGRAQALPGRRPCEASAPWGVRASRAVPTTVLCTAVPNARPGPTRRSRYGDGSSTSSCPLGHSAAKIPPLRRAWGAPSVGMTRQSGM